MRRVGVAEAVLDALCAAPAVGAGGAGRTANVGSPLALRASVTESVGEGATSTKTGTGTGEAMTLEEAEDALTAESGDSRDVLLLDTKGARRRERE
jgi:hypothetical protein